MLDRKCMQHVSGLQCYSPTTLFTNSWHPVWQLIHPNFFQSKSAAVVHTCEQGFLFFHFLDMLYTMLSTHRYHEDQGIL